MTANLWTQIVIVSIPAIASIIAAVRAAKAAGAAQGAQDEAARIRALEERVAGHKYDAYKPMLQTLGDMLTPGRGEKAAKTMEQVLPNFLTYISIWGSDEAVTAFFRYRLSASTGQQPPSVITIRLVADFITAARRDLAWPESQITGLESIGMRINDLHEHPEMIEAFSLNFDELAAKHNWTPPWKTPRLEA
ncbi:MAG: hypothetical protein L0H40_04930 [Micrococcaceae bacterium]|nr:hypothetical protein [Micrococcaceae bacterium]